MILKKRLHCFDDKSKCNVYDHFSCEKKREILIDRHYNFFFKKRSRYIKKVNYKVAKNKKHERKTEKKIAKTKSKHKKKTNKYITEKELIRHI